MSNLFYSIVFQAINVITFTPAEVPTSAAPVTAAASAATPTVVVVVVVAAAAALLGEEQRGARCGRRRL